MPTPLQQSQETSYTTDYIYSLPEGQRAELIDGKVYDMASPDRIHQRYVLELSMLISQYIKGKGGSCEVDVAPFAVFLNKDNRTYVEPDISVICDPDKLDDRGCNGAPDWIIEIASPSSRSMDYLIKLNKYRTAGVCEYWIVDPGKKEILTYNFETEEFGDYTFKDTVPVGIYPDFAIDFSSIII